MGRGVQPCAPQPAPVTVAAPSVCPAVLAYMQLLEDYSEPQPSVFYQTPQSEHIYQQKNKLLREVYGFNDSFSSEAPQELAPPPALPPKQRQLVSGPPLRDPRLPGTARLPTRTLCFLRRAPPTPHAGGGGAFLSRSSPAQLGLAGSQDVCFLC